MILKKYVLIFVWLVGTVSDDCKVTGSSLHILGTATENGITSYCELI